MMELDRWKHVNTSLQIAPGLLSLLIDPSLSIKDFISFLKEYPSAFAFSSQEQPPIPSRASISAQLVCFSDSVDSFLVSLLSVSFDSVISV